MTVLRAADEMRGIVQWDLSAYQPDVTVTAASMRFNVNSANANVLVSLYRAIQSWTEGVGTNGADADWLRHDTSASWATPGGDFNSTSLASFTPSATGWVTIPSSPALIALVQGWMDGSIPNSGIFLTATGSASQQMAINSVGTVDNVLSPQLIFTFNTNSRETHLTAGPSLVSNGGAIRVSMELSATQTITNVTPTLNQSGTNGVTATCGSPSPTPPTTVAANTPIVFTWTCTANANGNIGELTFTGGGTGALGAVFATATANSVLIAPPLTFKAVADGTVDPVVNTGYIKSASLIPTTPSDPVETAILDSIGDYVWADLDGDGTDNGGTEPPLSGVQVCATPVGGGAAVCDVTDANGNYRIFGLSNSIDYVVAITPSTLPANYLPTTPSSLTVTAAQRAAATLPGYYSDADFGLRPPGGASIGDTVWIDADEDGVVDGGKPCCPVSRSTSMTARARTCWPPRPPTPAALYTFTGLYAGNYVVSVDESSVVTTGHGVTSTLAAAMELVSGLNGNIVNPTNPVTVNVPTDSSAVDTADFGYNWTGSIGDYVWYDDNRNKLPDEGPASAIEGAFVQLYYDANNNNILEPSEYTLIGFATTAADGSYTIPNLPPGNYLVDVYEDSFTVDGHRDAIPTTPDVVAVDLNPAQAYVDADFGYYNGALIQGHVFHDDNRDGAFNGTESGLEPVEVTLTGFDSFGAPVSATTTTDGSGYFDFIVPEGTYTITYSTPDVLAIDRLLGRYDDTDQLYSDRPGRAGLACGSPVWRGQQRFHRRSGLP